MVVSVFDTKSLTDGLQTDGRVTILLTEDSTKKAFCRCDTFGEELPYFTVIDEACAYYFSNLDK